MLRWFCVLLPIATLACGSKAVDLDRAVLGSSADPTVVGTVHESVGQIVVDSERLYWTGAEARVQNHDYGSWALHGCLKENCAATVITYDSGTADIGTAAQGLNFGVIGSEIYWVRGATAIVAQSVAGGATRTVATIDASFVDAVYDGDGVYLSTPTGIYGASLSGTSAAPRLLASADISTYVLAVAAHGDYVYWLDGSSIGYTPTQDRAQTLHRIRKDGTAVETLAEGLEVNEGVQLVLDSNDAYWTRDVLVGGIERCPLAGCSGAPEIAVGPIRSPSAFILDGSTLYFQYETDAYRYAIAHCTLGQCAAPEPMLQGVDAMAAMAVDDQYLYAVTTAQDLDPRLSSQSVVAQIRRFPK